MAAHSASSSTGPHILFLPSGFVTPFTLTLTGRAHIFTIAVANNGAVTMSSKTTKA
jgi:hypothetical protein